MVSLGGSEETNEVSVRADAAASPSRALVAWLEIPSLHVLPIATCVFITICNKYVVGGGIPPGCNFSPEEN